MVHVRFEGRSYDLDARQLQVSGNLTDDAIKERLAHHLEVSPARLRFYVIDRLANDRIMVRPEAVYG